MKSISTLILALAGTCILASAVSAQTAPPPNIASIPQRKSYAPGNVVINGSNLGTALTVKVNGVSQPIIRRTAARLIVGPVAPQDPGFGTVQVIGSQASDSGTIQFLPTLTAVRHSARMNVTLNNGDVGTYTLRTSYTALGSPAIDQGFYGKRWIGFATPPIAAGVFTTPDPLMLTGILVPVDFGHIGAPLFLQAQCSATTSGVTAYTNLAAISGFGQPLP